MTDSLVLYLLVNLKPTWKVIWTVVSDSKSNSRVLVVNLEFVERSQSHEVAMSSLVTAEGSDREATHKALNLF